MEMNTLQALINKRAAQKLDADIDTLWKRVYSSGLLPDKNTGGMPAVFIKGENHEISTYPRSVLDLLNPSQNTMKTIRAYNLPRYIEEETKLFLKEIEDTKSRVESLESEIGNIYSAIPQ